MSWAELNEELTNTAALEQLYKLGTLPGSSRLCVCQMNRATFESFDLQYRALAVYSVTGMVSQWESQYR